jgi:hypothetical protein
MEQELLIEIANLLGCSLDDVTDEDIARQECKGWSMSVDGHPYCLCCGCNLAESLEKLKGRKACGICHTRINE